MGCRGEAAQLCGRESSRSLRSHGGSIEAGFARAWLMGFCAATKGIANTEASVCSHSSSYCSSSSPTGTCSIRQCYTSSATWWESTTSVFGCCPSCRIWSFSCASRCSPARGTFVCRSTCGSTAFVCTSSSESSAIGGRRPFDGSFGGAFKCTSDGKCTACYKRPVECTAWKCSRCSWSNHRRRRGQAEGGQKQRGS